MQVTDVDAVPIRRDLDERFANAQKWIDAREYCLVRVTAADGTVGWGECWGPVAGNREVVEEFLAPRVEGRRVADVEQVHADLRTALRGAYHSHVPTGALSGVDVALWDCHARQRDAPLADLLGGRRRSSVRAYATGHFWPDADVAGVRDAVVAEARGHVEAGFTALKQKIGLHAHPDFDADWRDDVALVGAVREAVGEDVDLAVDANHAYDRATAARVARALADLDVLFFEEPVGPSHVAEYERLNDAIDVPLAGGECWAFADGFERVVEGGGVSYVQPDVTSAGGVTSTRRVAWHADAHNVQCLPHVFGSAVAVGASLQVLATLPGDPLLEFDRTPNPLRDDLAREPFDRDGTVVAVPDRPGIGVEVDRDVLASFRVD